MDGAIRNQEKYCKTPVIRVLEIFALLASSMKKQKTSTQKMECELRVSERLTFNAKITSTQLVCVDATIYRHFTVINIVIGLLCITHILIL